MRWRKRGPSWAQLGVVLGVILALLVVSPALGGPSLRSLVQQEVARQLDQSDLAASAKKKKKKNGPRGPAGPAGANGAIGATGANGPAGSARAYARVQQFVDTPCSPQCTIDHAKGITSVTHDGPGDYCVNAPGIDPSAPFTLTVDISHTDSPQANASAQADFETMGCTIDGQGDFEVRTVRLESGVSNPSDTVSFTIVIP